MESIYWIILFSIIINGIVASWHFQNLLKLIQTFWDNFWIVTIWKSKYKYPKYKVYNILAVLRAYFRFIKEDFKQHIGNRFHSQFNIYIVFYRKDDVSNLPIF